MTPGIPDTYICPNCGAEVPVGTQFCPGCSPDKSKNWSQDSIYDGLDLPDSYDEEAKFQKKVRRNKIMITFISAILLLIFIFGYIFK